MRPIIKVKILALIFLGLITAFGCQSNTKTYKETNKVEWIDVNQLKPGNIKHEQLTDIQIERIKKVQSVFAEVDNSSLETWIDNFKRDTNPDREIEIWEKMARAYSKYINGKTLTLEAKKDVMQVLLLRSSAPEEEVINHLELKALTKADAEVIMQNY